MLAIFLVSFAQVFLVSFNARNTVQSRYAAAFFVSLLITLLWSVNIKLLASGNYSVSYIFWDGVGGALGVVSGAFFHKKFMKKKPITEW